MKIYKALTRFSGSPAMKFLSVVFLAGLALCYAVPFEETRELSVDEVQELDFLLSQVLEEQRQTRDVKETLKNMFDRLMEKVAEMTEKGKEVNSGLIDRVKNLLEKLKEKGIDLQDKIRERGGSLPEKARDLWNKFLERLGIGEKEYAEGKRHTRDIKETLKNMFDRLIEKVAEMTEKGKEVNSGLIDRVKNLLEKLKEKGVDFQDKIRERGGSLPEKARDLWNKFLERLGIGEKEYAEGIRSSRDVKETLRNMFDRLMEKVAEMTEKGKEINGGLVDRVRNLLEKLKDKGIDLREKIRERGGSLPEKAQDLWKKFLERLGIGEKEYAEDEDEIKTELGRALRDHLNGILDLIRESIERGKVVKEETLQNLKDIYLKMKELRIELGIRAKEQLQKIKEKGKVIWQKIKNIFGKNKQEIEAEEDTKERFNKILNKLVERLRKFLESGRKIRQSIVDRVKDVLQKMKDIGMNESEVDGKFTDLLRRLSEKGKEALRELMERLGIKRDENTIEYADDEDEDGDGGVKEKMGRILQKFLDRLKNVLEQNRDISQRVVDRMKDLIQKMKNVGMGDSDISGKFSDLFKKLTDKGKDALDRLMTRLGLKREERMIEFADAGDDDEDEGVQGRMGKILQQFLDRLKNVLEKNRNISQRIVDRMKDLIRKMKNLGIGDSDINGKFSDLLKKLTDKGKEALDRLMKRLGLKQEERMIEYADDGEISKDIREKFEELVQKIKDALENNRSFRDGLEKLKEIRERLKDLRVTLGDKAKDLVEKLREKIREYFQKWMEKFHPKEERSLKEVYENIKEYLKNLQIDLKEKFAKFGEWAKEKFEKGLEKGRDRTETLRKLAREFIHDAKLLGKDTVLQAKYFFREYKEDLGELYVVVKEKIREKLETIEVYERVREYLRNFKIELREKFAKFGEWAKEKFEKGLEQGKDRTENVRNLARQFIHDAKVIGRDVAEQAKEFFQEYKGDLGTIYDRVREKVREILERQD